MEIISSTKRKSAFSLPESREPLGVHCIAHNKSLDKAAKQIVMIATICRCPKWGWPRGWQMHSSPATFHSACASFVCGAQWPITLRRRSVCKRVIRRVTYELACSRVTRAGGRTLQTRAHTPQEEGKHELPFSRSQTDRARGQVFSSDEMTSALAAYL